jgi:hypothetical protein
MSKASRIAEVARVDAILANARENRNGPNGEHVPSMATCGTCKRTWDDAKGSELTPTPAARCPYEYAHEPHIPRRRLKVEVTMKSEAFTQPSSSLASVFRELATMAERGTLTPALMDRVKIKDAHGLTVGYVVIFAHE